MSTTNGSPTYFRNNNPYVLAGTSESESDTLYADDDGDGGKDMLSLSISSHPDDNYTHHCSGSSSSSSHSHSRNTQHSKSSQSTHAFSFHTIKTILYDDIPVVANIASAIMGVSVFAMPWGFLQSGLLGGSIITIIVSYLSFETARILLYAQRSLFESTGHVKSYAEIASDTLGGSQWGHLVKLATVISCLGSCVGYLIFLGEICGQLFNISFYQAVIIAILPLTLLSWIRSFRELTLFTMIGIVAIVVTIIYVVYDGQFGDHPTASDIIYNHRHKNSMSGIKNTPLFLPHTFLNFVGPATFLFTSHYCILSMGAEALQERAVKAATVLSATTRQQDPEIDSNSCGHDNSVNDNNSHDTVPLLLPSQSSSHTQQLPQSGQLSQSLQQNECLTSDSGKGLQLVFTTSNNTYPLTVGLIDEINFNINGTSHSTSIAIKNLTSFPQLPRQQSSTSIYSSPIHSTEIAAAAITTSNNGIDINNHNNNGSPSKYNNNTNNNNFNTIPIDQMGSSDNLSVSIESLNRPVAAAYILSAALIIVHGSTGYVLFRCVDFVTDSSGVIEAGCEGRVCQNIILNLSDTVVRDCIGLVLCIAIVVSYVLLLAPAREHVEASIMKRLDGYHTYLDTTASTTTTATTTTWIRNIIRMCLVTLTAVTACWTPYFGALLGKVGGLTDALQAFVLPPLIYLTLHSHELATWQIIVYKGIFVWGVGTMVYTLISFIHPFT